MNRIVAAIITTTGIACAQDAAVSSYLNPEFSGNADVRIREVRAPLSGYAIGTYWCTLGYGTTGDSHGYGGMQWTPDNSQGPKNFIYSQWNDYTTDAYHDQATQVKTFGGEGTGVKSVNNDPLHQWKPGFWHVTADRVWNEGNRTYFAYITRDGETGIWRHLMTWSTPEANLKFTWSYMFLEDWRGDGAYRESNVRKGWNRSTSGSWTPLTEYKYNVNTGDLAPGGRSANKNTNWAGGIKSDETGQYFYMGAGGDVVCTNNNETKYTINRTETSPQEEYGTAKIATMIATPLGTNNVEIKWTTDKLTVPQWAYKITIKDGSTVLGTVQDTMPQCRIDTVNVGSLNLSQKQYAAVLEITDFFDGSATKTVSFGNGAVQDFLVVETPAAGTSVEILTPLTIKWDAILSDSVDLTLVDNNGEVLSIGAALWSDKQINWTVPATVPAGTTYRIAIQSRKSPSLNDTSDQFSVTHPDLKHKRISQSRLTVASFTNQQPGSDNAAANVIDGNTGTIWHTNWSGTPSHPHEIVLKTDSTFAITGVAYRPRQDGDNGRIKAYEIYVSANGQTWGSAVKTGSFADGSEEQSITFPSVTGQYVKIVSLSSINGSAFTSVAELNILADFTGGIVETLSGAKRTAAPAVAIHGNSLFMNASQVKSISLFGINGRLIRELSPASQIDLGTLNLSKGFYILNVQSLSGVSTIRYWSK